MKIAIIGYGWLGLPLAQSLRQNGDDVIGTSTDQLKVDRLNAEGLNTVFFSGEASAELTHALGDCDWIVITIPPSGNADYVWVLNEILKAASPSSKVVFTSSIGVYREINGQVDEQSPLKEDHPVVKAEYFLRDQLKNRLTILRLGGLIGGERHPVKYLAGRKDLEGGENPVNLIQLEDVVEAIKIIVENDIDGQLFNLVFPVHPTKKSYYTLMTEKMNLEAPQFIEGERNGKIVNGERITLNTNFTYSKSIM
jgi:nucleoside-diphosphate-sugar epimerase